MPMEIHDDKIIMRAGKYNMPYVVTPEDVELLKWAINTIDYAEPLIRAALSDFASPDRITDLRNLVQQIEEAQNG